MMALKCSLLALLFSISYASTYASSPGEVVSSFDAPSSRCSALASDGDSLWVADWFLCKLFKLDATTGEVLLELDSPCYSPQGLASDGENLYVADANTEGIYVLDLESGKTVSSYGAPGPEPSGLAYDGENLWLADAKQDNLYKLNPLDGTTLGYFKAPSRNVTGLAFDGTYLWACDRVKDELYPLTTEDGTVLAILPSPGEYPSGLACHGGSLHAVDFQTDKLDRLATRETEPYTVTDEKKARMQYVHTLRNAGSGFIREAEIHLALPADPLENQRLLSELEFEPEPDRVQVDKWGQKTAVFTFRDVPPGKRVGASYQVAFETGALNYLVWPESVGSLQDIPTELAESYTADGSRYRIATPAIADTATEIVGDEKNPYWIARKLYEWTLSKLDYELVGGWDVPEVLIKRGTGSCSEYSFLFIALCRASGIPARFEAAVARRGDNAAVDDVFHRWCEVYLPKFGWIPVDPSGGDSPWPAARARHFGNLDDRFFITTHGGGDSESLGWRYNSNSFFTYEGTGEVEEEAFGIWEPHEEEEGE